MRYFLYSFLLSLVLLQIGTRAQNVVGRPKDDSDGARGDLIKYLRMFRKFKDDGSQSASQIKRRLRILGGQTSTPNAYPSIVSIWTDSLDTGIYEHSCGGVIITKTAVLTAAHCVYFAGFYRYTPKQLRIVAGEHDLKKRSQNEQIRSVKQIIIHEVWETAQDTKADVLDGDICVLLLDAPFQLNDFVKTVPISKYKVVPGDQCVVAGWGKLSNNVNEASQYLQELVVEAITLDRCAKLLEVDKSSYITNGMICAGIELHKDSCSGDSGGPLYCLNKDRQVFVAGIVSWGLSECGEGKPGVYTRVGEYTDWVIKKLNTPMGPISAAGGNSQEGPKPPMNKPNNGQRGRPEPSKPKTRNMMEQPDPSSYDFYDGGQNAVGNVNPATGVGSPLASGTLYPSLFNAKNKRSFLLKKF